MKFLAYLLISILILTSVVAHEDGLVEVIASANDGQAVIGDLHVVIKTLPSLPAEGSSSAVVLQITDHDGNPVSGLAPVGEILRQDHNFVENEKIPGTYNLDYTFIKFGQEEFTVKVGQDSQTFEVEVGAPLQSSPVGNILLAVMVIGLGVLAYFTFVKKNMKIGSAVIYAVILLIVAGLGYSLFAYNTSSAVQGCTIEVGGVYVYHCHQSIKVEICGDTKAFAWEVGSLGEGGHTHKGNHRIHWHPDEPSEDPFAEMTLRNLFEDLDLTLTQTSVEDPESNVVFSDEADACNDGNDNKITVYETLEHATESTVIENFLDHPMQDESEYRIIYS